MRSTFIVPLLVLVFVFATKAYSDTVPVNENFDGVSAPALPVGWSSIVTSTSSASKVETTTSESPKSTPNHVRLYNSYDNSATVMLITPQFTDLTGQSNQIRFYAKADNDGQELIIGTITNPIDTSTFTGFDTITLSDDYYEYIVLFDANYTENDEYIVFKHGLGGTYRTIYIDNFNYEAIPSCPTPDDLTVDNIVADGADLSWTERGAATTWHIMIGEEGFDTTGMGYETVYNDTITIDTLADNTDYDWYVRADCGGGDTSRWKGPNTFSTLCNAITVDYSEDFDGVSDPELPDCWSSIIVSNSQGTKVETYSYAHPHSTPLHVRLYNANDTTADLLLVTPQFGDLTDQTNQIRFYAKTFSPVSLLIGTLSDATDETTFNEIESIDLTTEYVEYVIEFDTSYHESDEYIAFKHGQDTTYRTIFIDDFVYEPIPACKEPSDQFVDNIAEDGAELNWTENGTANYWDIYIVEIGEDPPDENTTPTIDNTQDNPYEWYDGDDGTTYDWYVRSDCGQNNSDVSVWKGYHAFSTLITNDSCSGATELSVGYEEDWRMGTNKGATDSENNPYPIPDPVCGSYNGSDVWFSVDVPSNGYVKISSERVPRSDLDNSDMAVYSGECDALALVTCNDNGPVNSMAEIIINDQNWADSTLYVRFWSHGNADVGPFRISASTQPDTAIWTGTEDESWDNSENWDVNGVPGNITNVLIPAGLSVYPTIDVAAYCNDLTIQSNASGTASLIGVEYLTIGGTTTVELYVTGGKWHNIASPVDNATLNALYTPDYETWIWGYNESTDSWANITSLTTPFPFGKGFNYWLQTAARANRVIEFQGDLMTTSLTLTNSTIPALTYTDATHGYNFVGNPYTCALDWDEGSWDTTNISGVVWVWKTSSGASGNYVVRNAQGVGSLTDGIIPMCQGFFVRALSATPSLTIPLDARVHSDEAYYKSSKTNSLLSAGFTVSQNGNQDEVWITFDSKDSDAYDMGHDAEKRFGSETSPQLYFNQGSYQLSINALGLLSDDEKVVPLSFQAGQNGNHTLTANLDALENTKVVLEDIHTGVIHDLTKEPTYIFNAGISQDVERFRLHFFYNPNSIKESISQKLTIYRFSNHIYIKCSDEMADVEKDITVYDMLGRVVLQTKTEASSISRIPFSFDGNLFVVKVVTEKGTYTSKIY
jgi:hypothetical protein